MKKIKKKEVMILSALLALVLLFGTVAVWTVNRYRKTGLALLREFSGEYQYDGLYLSATDRALTFTLTPPEYFTEYPKETLDLAPFGFPEKTLSYFKIGGVLLPLEEGYEGFWPVCREDRTVYRAEDGKIWAIEPKAGRCYPLFTGSVEGVDEYAEGVLAFGEGAKWALALDGTEVTLYQADPMTDSLHIQKTVSISLSEHADEVRFGGFTGQSQCYFVALKDGKESYLALNCTDGAVAVAPTLSDGMLGEAVDRVFAPYFPNDAEDPDRVWWFHLLLGTQFSARLEEGCAAPRLMTVSPTGTRSLWRAEKDGAAVHFVVTEKRCFALETVLEPSLSVERAVFLYDNVLFVTLKNTATGEVLSRAYTVLF